VHLKYLAPMLSPAVMAYLIQQSLLPNVTPRQTIDGIWNAFASPYARQPGGLKDHVAQVMAFISRPRYASGVLRRLRRIVGLYRELRFRAKFDVSLNPSLDGMTIKRGTRDRGSRRYLVSPAFLDQKFADGGQVTASHLRNIVAHLDDYV
jgi:hypothetical protein